MYNTQGEEMNTYVWWVPKAISSLACQSQDTQVNFISLHTSIFPILIIFALLQEGTLFLTIIFSRDNSRITKEWRELAIPKDLSGLLQDISFMRLNMQTHQANGLCFPLEGRYANCTLALRWQWEYLDSLVILLSACDRPLNCTQPDRSGRGHTAGPAGLTGL